MAKKEKIESKAALELIWPNWEDLLLARGISVDEANRQLEKMFLNFPQGIPRQIVLDWVLNTFDTSIITNKLADVVIAAEKVWRTGKGPVAHSSAELA